MVRVHADRHVRQPRETCDLRPGRQHQRVRVQWVRNQQERAETGRQAAPQARRAARRWWGPRQVCVHASGAARAAVRKGGIAEGVTVARPHRDARPRRRPGDPDEEAKRTSTSRRVCASSGVGPSRRTHPKDGRGLAPPGCCRPEREGCPGRPARGVAPHRRHAPDLGETDRRAGRPPGRAAPPAASPRPASHRNARDTSRGTGLTGPGAAEGTRRHSPMDRNRSPLRARWPLKRYRG